MSGEVISFMTLFSLPNDSQKIRRCKRRQMEVFENVEGGLEIKGRSLEDRMTQNGKKRDASWSIVFLTPKRQRLLFSVLYFRHLLVDQRVIKPS